MHKYNIVNVTRPVPRATVDPVANGRKAIVATLNKQIELHRGGVTKRTNYFEKDGKHFFKLAYGTYNLLGKGNHIEMVDVNDVPTLVLQLTEDVDKGEFDEQIKDISANYARRRAA